MSDSGFLKTFLNLWRDIDEAPSALDIEPEFLAVIFHDRFPWLKMAEQLPDYNSSDSRKKLENTDRYL